MMTTLAIEQHDWLEGAKTPEFPVLDILVVTVIIAAIAAAAWYGVRRIAK